MISSTTAQSSLSVIIPAYGRPTQLRDAINSILESLPEAGEVIVVDDHPSVNVNLGALNIRDKRIRLIRSGPSSGGANAKTVGVANARGQWITFLDDDDLFLPGGCARILEATKAAPDIELFFLRTECLSSNPQDTEAFEKTTNELLNKYSVNSDGLVRRLDPEVAIGLFDKVPISFQRFAVKKSAFNKTRGFGGLKYIWDNFFAIESSLRFPTALIEPPVTVLNIWPGNIFSKRSLALNQQDEHVTILRRTKDLARTHRSSKIRLEHRKALAEQQFSAAYMRLCRHEKIGQALTLLVQAQVNNHSLYRWKSIGRLLRPSQR